MADRGRPRGTGPRVSAKERATWALERLLAAVDRFVQHPNDPALFQALIARRREQAAADRFAHHVENRPGYEAGSGKRPRGRPRKYPTVHLPQLPLD